MAMGAFLAGDCWQARNTVMRWKAISNHLKFAAGAVFHRRWHVDRLWHAAENPLRIVILLLGFLIIKIASCG